MNKPVKVTGKVTQMRWSNPHGWLYLEVTGPDGKLVNWAFELNSTNALIRQGWKKEDLPVGTMLVVDGYQARNGQPVANATSVTFTDGRKLLAARRSQLPSNRCERIFGGPAPTGRVGPRSSGPFVQLAQFAANLV